MDAEQKCERIMRHLRALHQRTGQVPECIASLESCLTAPDAPTTAVLVPTVPDTNLSHIYLRTRKTDEVEEFLRSHGEHELPAPWHTMIDDMLSKIAEFEVFVPEAGKADRSQPDSTRLERMVTRRY